MDASKTIANVTEIKNELRMTSQGQRWDYVKVEYSDGTNDRRYFHVDCDCITDDDGRCIMCHKNSPGCM